MNSHTIEGRLAAGRPEPLRGKTEMKESKTMVRRAGLTLAACAFLFGTTIGASAQTASATYKGTSRDPFAKYTPPVKRKVEKKVVKPVDPPSVQERIEKYKAMKMAAMSMQQAAPKPTTAFLLSELQVVGIFRTPRGYAAMVEATPIKLSYTVYPGEPFFDGMLVAIEETRLVFRRQTRWTDGRVEVAVETKQLRQPNAVADSMTTPKNANGEDPTSSAAPSNTETKESQQKND